jgi:hypothetical protein
MTMVTRSIASQLASDGLRQHMYTAGAEVAEFCSVPGEWCWSSSECCSGWCAWTFHCALK